MSIWLCRAGRDGEFAVKFFEDHRIYCTWGNLKVSLNQFTTKQDLQKYFIDSNSDIKVKTAINWSSQVWPFCHEMRKGELVVLPSKVKPVIHFGKIVGDYEFHDNNENPYYHSRKVDWFIEIPRKNFEQDILYSFGAFMTICRIKQEGRVKSIIDTLQHGKQVSVIADAEDEEECDSFDIELEARDKINNLIIRKTKGHGLAKIVNSILQAKGFTTYISPEGPDNGVDILASSGILGFGSHKICVQVKSTDKPIDRSILDQLGGVMKNVNAEYGLLVSWSGFTSSIQRDEAKQFFNIRLWSHKEVVEEFLQHYDDIDDSIKEFIPLKKIWVVNQPEE